MQRFAVIGMGRFGSRLAENLAAAGAEVIAVDIDRDLIEEMRDRVTLAVAMDGADEQSLKLQGIDKVDVAVVGMGQDFESNVLATLTLKRLGVQRVISRAQSRRRGRILARIGADAVVYPELEVADRWAHRLLSPNIRDHVELAEGHSLVEIEAPKEWHNQSLAKLELRSRYGINLVAIKRRVAGATESGAERLDEYVIDTPLPHSIIQPSDRLLAVGPDEALQKLPR